MKLSDMGNVCLLFGGCSFDGGVSENVMVMSLALHGSLLC